MKFILRLSNTYQGYKILREDWGDSPELVFMDCLGTFKAYTEAKSIYDFILSNISNDLFKIVSISTGTIVHGQVTQQLVEYKENSLLDLKLFYNKD